DIGNLLKHMLILLQGFFSQFAFGDFIPGTQILDRLSGFVTAKNGVVVSNPNPLSIRVLHAAFTDDHFTIFGLLNTSTNVVKNGAIIRMHFVLEEIIAAFSNLGSRIT